MLFAGNWNPVEDIVVDKVGKYVYELKSHVGNADTHVIVDVTVDGHSKVRPFRSRSLSQFLTDHHGTLSIPCDESNRQEAAAVW